MIFLISFPLYLKVAHLDFGAVGRFLYSVFMVRDVLGFCSRYNCCSVVRFYNIWYYSLASLGTGYMFNVAFYVRVAGKSRARS
jgi:hypothetical protein